MREDRLEAAAPGVLGGLVDVASSALGGLISTVAGMHAAIADKPFTALRLPPGTAGSSDAARVVHDSIASIVYTSLHAAVSLTAGMAHGLVRLAPAQNREPSPGSIWDRALAALNGFAGERLAAADNPLATQMGLRIGGTRIALEREILTAAYPDATSRLVIFVHGLASSEGMWRLHAERHYGDVDTTYGTRLHRELGYTPLYLRYNSGLHISDNGRALACLLDRVVREWMMPVDEIVLVGHSMGGLVIRSACHYGRQEAHAWTELVRHVFFLGSPHLGAPLEKAANLAAWILAQVDVTRPLANLLNRRSAGVKDLRFGALVDEHWPDADDDALWDDRTTDVPLLAGANHYFIAARVTHDARHPLGIAIGDLLVRETSALGRGRRRRIQFPLEHGRRFGSMHHLELLNHPDVYAQMHRWLTRQRFASSRSTLSGSESGNRDRQTGNH